MWECPHCKRRFGRSGQGHECAPALSLEEYFETGPAFERPIFERIRDELAAVDPELWCEPVSVGIFFKRRSTFLSLRTMQRWIAVCFHLERQLTSSRLSRKVVQHGSRWYHVVNIAHVQEIDDELIEWLVEAWEFDAP